MHVMTTSCMFTRHLQRLSVLEGWKGKHTPMPPVGFRPDLHTYLSLDTQSEGPELIMSPHLQ